MEVQHFPAPPDVAAASRKGKPLCSWREKSKPCETCGAPITNLPKSVYITRKYCGLSCRKAKATNPKKAHKSTKSRRAMGRLLADVVEHLTDLEWWDCCVMALLVMENYHHGKDSLFLDKH